MNQDEMPARDASARWSLIAAASLVAILLLYRPYQGIYHDARIYMGYALAALDPGGVGRDLLFVQDEQSGYSVFPRLLTAVTGLLGPSTAAMVVTLAGLSLWITAAAALFSRLARGVALWAVLICVLALSATYGGFATFSYGEAFASPRVFAEAGVMLALALLMQGRTAAPIAMFAASALIHPIMAAPGIAVGFVLLAAGDRRWLYAGAAVLACGLGTAAAGLPMAGRLFQGIDPAWLFLLRTRSAYLFPSLWPAEDYARLATQLATLLIAALYAEGRARTLLLAIGGVAGGGLALSLILGDLLPSLLITQLQTWRALWLGVLAANGALALAAIALWRAGRGGQVALAILVMAWLLPDSGWGGVALVVAALGMAVAHRTGRLPEVSRLVFRAVAVITALVTVTRIAQLGLGLAGHLSIGWAAGAPVGWVTALAVDLPRLPLAAAAIAVVLAPPSARVAWWAGAGTAVLAALALIAWDSREPFRRATDEGRNGAELRALLAPYPGEVVWIDGGIEPWLLAGRPEWASSLQGAAMVFSRPLALSWGDHMRELVALGLAKPSALNPFTGQSDAPPTRPAASGLAALCRRPDAPAAVIMPGAAPAGLSALTWRPAAPNYAGYGVGGGYAWRRVTAYAVVPCAWLRPVRPSGSPPGRRP